MRIDILTSTSDELRRVDKVLFNGVEQKYVVMADDERGEIARYVVDKDGHLIDDGTGYYRQEIMRGKVLIIFRDEEQGG